MPVATSDPMTEPAEVPTMYSASVARQPVSDSSASSAPMSHDAPTTPPAPRTNPTRITNGTPIWGKTPANLGPGSSHAGARSQVLGHVTRWSGGQTFAPPNRRVRALETAEECGRRDSNPHGLRHRHLKPAWLPVPPRPRGLPHGPSHRTYHPPPYG